MEEKQLNFNQPFLSVRRHTSTATSVRTRKKSINISNTSIPQLPSHTSELKSGPIRHPGAVPFLWEQSPGQPKEKLSPPIHSWEKPPAIPKLPPGRHPKADGDVRRDADVTNNSVDGNVETRKEEECSESGDEAYVDALDTLSRAESSFLNCSMSGLSENVHVKPSGNLTMNREFMMDRFLPAAKAMATETTPEYAPKKQPFLRKQMKRTVNQHKPSLRYTPSFAHRYSYSQDNKGGEESDDDEYDEPQNMPAICGLLPRFRLKSSLCLLSPVPAMSCRTRVLPSCAKKVERTPSSAGSCDEIEDEKVKSPDIWPCSPKKGDASGVPSSRDEDLEITTKRIDQMSIVDSALNDLKKFIAVDVDKKLLPNDQDSSVIEQVSTEGFEKHLSKAVTLEKCFQIQSGLPAPPPLPKSPSDSWLWRTLPSTKNPPLRSYLGSTTTNNEKQLKTGPTSDHKKWETIVKATNVKHHHLHYSEDMLPTIPET